jgi:hypothetical protein
MSTTTITTNSQPQQQQPEPLYPHLQPQPQSQPRPAQASRNPRHRALSTSTKKKKKKRKKKKKKTKKEKEKVKESFPSHNLQLQPGQLHSQSPMCRHLRDRQLCRSCTTVLSKGGSRIRIFIRFLDDSAISLDVGPSDTILSVKQMMKDKGYFLCPDWCRLFFSRRLVRELQDGRTLADYNIQKDSTLHCLVDLDKPPPKRPAMTDEELRALITECAPFLLTDNANLPW